MAAVPQQSNRHPVPDLPVRQDRLTGHDGQSTTTTSSSRVSGIRRNGSISVFHDLDGHVVLPDRLIGSNSDATVGRHAQQGDLLLAVYVSLDA